MFKDLTRGGQVNIHQFRMMKQVLRVGLYFGTCIFLIILSYNIYAKRHTQDFSSGVGFIKASVVNFTYDGFIMLGSNSDELNSKRMIFYTNNWRYKREAPARAVIRNSIIQNKFSNMLDFLISEMILAFKLSIALILSLYSIWILYGRKVKAPNITKGGEILDAKQASKLLRRAGIASEFQIGNLPFVKDKETSHIMITGTTGSGKSNCMNSLLPQIRNKNQPAIIIDLTGEMVERYYDAEKGDIILNPFDDRGYSWDFWQEIKDQHSLQIIANSLYAGKGSNWDEMWNNSSKQFFLDAISVSQNHQDIKELHALLAKKSLKEVSTILHNTAIGSVMSPQNEKTALSIRTNTTAYLEWLQHLTEKEATITIADWMKQSTEEHNGRWLFLSSTPKQRNIVRPFYSMLLDLCINQSNSSQAITPSVAIYDTLSWFINGKNL